MDISDFIEEDHDFPSEFTSAASSVTGKSSTKNSELDLHGKVLPLNSTSKKSKSKSKSKKSKRSKNKKDPKRQSRGRMSQYGFEPKRKKRSKRSIAKEKSEAE